MGDTTVQIRYGVLVIFIPFKNSTERTNNRKEKIEIIRNYKSEHGCSICGEKEPVCLDFHHINKDKEYSIARMINDGYSLEKIFIEIKKTTIVCKNCHAKIHLK